MPIINPSFETGNFTGWTVTIPTGGSAAVVTSFTTPFAPTLTFNPVNGNFFALLKTDGPDNFTSVSQTFSACAGDTISGWTFFQSPEIPITQFNDFAEVRILLGAAVVATPYFASVNTTGDTGWVNWTHTFISPGTYTLVARVTNVGRAAFDSFMGLDAISLVTAPLTITCPGNITVSNDPGECGAVVNYPDPIVSCLGVSSTCSPPSGSFFPAGTTTVTCTATDASGNTATCTFTATVNDTEPPTITCPPSITVPNDPGECGAVVNYPDPLVSDNCPGVTSSCSPPSGSFFPAGTTTVTCSATDASGNTANCTFTVTVNDTEPPTITCPPNIIITGDPDLGGAIVNYSNPVVSDNCPGAIAICSPPSSSLFPFGTTTVTCTATDAAGNTAACSFTVTVVEQRFRLSSKMIINLRLKLLQNQQIRIETDEND
ncbi:HYR domain-containing protein [Bacillus sp. NEB1478]|uniref:HYR domain-containing protein n=1 Tax=Bacillus sp. NEB1478 TaxID=3073816 RepID=UPI002873CE1C|nr:HYR domain-containing protein [Bacillus sp. NEB1478]WNB90836.1 HYR domain-containing protein [Bacillus sp. NEB1478]